ncbi:MAG TPA: hypothetical protein VLG69_01000 [Candidatus Andersenbacteria bacterium]|nr:hypothetical protein [Candidatus Andersenbacteria bacterium]
MKQVVNQSSVLTWGNWAISPLGEEYALWVADDAIRIKGHEKCSFPGLGKDRMILTAHLWQMLDLHEMYPRGWLYGQKLPPGISAQSPINDFIVGRKIYPYIIQCTIDEKGYCPKQTASTLSEESPNPEDNILRIQENIFDRTCEESKEITRRLRELCEKSGIIAMTGTRISWGVTKESGILTPIGGIGLPDHTRYHHRMNHPENFMDRRMIKVLLPDETTDMNKMRAAGCRARSKYEAISAILLKSS